MATFDYQVIKRPHRKTASISVKPDCSVRIVVPNTISDEKIAELKIKIDAKLAQIEQQKQAKRQQQNEQRLIQAREAEAMAAQRRAAAAEQANNQASWDSVNRSIQNMNNNMQMQQLNNNLMRYNFMPKRYDVYLH